MEQTILFIFLSLFPFGQIIRIGIIQPIDVVVGIGALWAIFKKYEKPGFFTYFEDFLFVAIFSWLVGSLLFWQKEALFGFLYLLRLGAYFYFFVFVYHFAKNQKQLLVDSLLTVSVASAIFGWIQFFMIPSLKAFFYFGWDEHLYRLVGTFLDPAFLGIILVFGLIFSIYRFLESKKIIYSAISIFLMISLAFTYSRASYLAFFAGILTVAYYKKFLEKAILIILAFVILMVALPVKGNHILSFTREFSALARIDNYSQTWKIFMKSPVIGVGYDNMCLARNKFIGFESFSSHSCSGSDSSILYILATTGIVGLMVLGNAIWRIGKSLRKNSSFFILFSSFIALLVHSFFTNSMFYPWVMGYIFILLAVTLTE